MSEKIGKSTPPNNKQKNQTKQTTMKANDLSNFTFRHSGWGCYQVTYTTGRGDSYVADINDMMIIDRTLHADWAKLSTIKHLAYLCRLLGRHYHANGTPFKALNGAR